MSSNVTSLAQLLICFSEGFEIRSGHRWCTHRIGQVHFSELANIYRSLRDAYCSRLSADQRDEEVIAAFDHYITLSDRAGTFTIQDETVAPEMITRATERDWSVLFEAAVQSAINQTKLGEDFQSILHSARLTLSAS